MLTATADTTEARTTKPLDADDYNDRNRELFTRRSGILESLRAVRALPEADMAGEQRREHAKLARDLDRVTTDIIELNRGLVRNYVKRFTSHTSREDSADFEAAGTLGLMRAIDTYDPKMGRFAQWAYKPIQREVLEAVHAADHPNMNRGDWERRGHILKAIARLSAGKDSGYTPSYAEIAAASGATTEQVRRVLEAPRLESLSTPMGDDRDTTLAEFVEDPSGSLEDAVLTRMSIETLEAFGLSALDSRELFVIVRRFGLDGEPEQKLSAIGEILGLSREAVRQVESKALAKIGHPAVLRKLARDGRG